MADTERMEVQLFLKFTDDQVMVSRSIAGSGFFTIYQEEAKNVELRIKGRLNLNITTAYPSLPFLLHIYSYLGSEYLFYNKVYYFP